MIDDDDLATLRKATKGSKSGTKALSNVEAVVAEMKHEADVLNLKVSRLHSGNDNLARWVYRTLDERDHQLGISDMIRRAMERLLVDARREDLFQRGQFKLHSGAASRWKIDCDTLSDEEWMILAEIAMEHLTAFGSVEGVPTGGLKFAAALKPYIKDPPMGQTTPFPVLIVDDVLTTGASMYELREGRSAHGVVVFARGPCPRWITPLFRLTGSEWMV